MDDGEWKGPSFGLPDYTSAQADGALALPAVDVPEVDREATAAVTQPNRSEPRPGPAGAQAPQPVGAPAEPAPEFPVPAAARVESGRQPFADFPSGPVQTSSGSSAPFLMIVAVAAAAILFAAVIGAVVNSGIRSSDVPVGVETSVEYPQQQYPDEALDQLADIGWQASVPQGWYVTSSPEGHLALENALGEQVVFTYGFDSADLTQDCRDLASSTVVAATDDPAVSQTKLGGRDAVRLTGDNWTALCSRDLVTGQVLGIIVPPESTSQHEWTSGLFSALQSSWRWS